MTKDQFRAALETLYPGQARLRQLEHVAGWADRHRRTVEKWWYGKVEVPRLVELTLNQMLREQNR